MSWGERSETSVAWPGALVIAVVVTALMLLARPGPAAAEEPLKRSCSATALITGAGILPEQPGCATGPVLCPVESAGCAFSASIRMTAELGVGPLRGRLRIKDPDTGSIVDFYCSSGPGETCMVQPTAFVPAGQRYDAICAATKENVQIQATVRCGAEMSPLGGF